MNSTLVNLRMIRSLPAAYAACVLLGAQTPTVNQTARRRIRTPPARDRVEHVEGRKLTESLQGASQGLHPVRRFADSSTFRQPSQRDVLMLQIGLAELMERTRNSRLPAEFMATRQFFAHVRASDGPPEGG